MTTSAEHRPGWSHAQWAAGDSPFVMPEWAELADALLAREAARRHRSPDTDPFSSMRVTRAEVEAALAHDRRPGTNMDGTNITGPDGRAEAASKAFRASLEQANLLSSLRLLAGADDEDLEVLALLVAIEMAPPRQRAVAYLQDNVALTRPTLATLAALFPPPHRGVWAVSATSALHCAALVGIDNEGPWGSRAVSVPSPVIWALAGDPSPDHDLPPSVRYMPGRGQRAPGGGLVLITGADRQSRLQAAVSELPVMGLLVTPPPEDEPGWKALVREATLGGAAVVIETDKPLLAAGAHHVDQALHLWWAISSPNELPLESLPQRSWRERRLEPSKAGPADWQRALGSQAPEGLRLDREELRLLALAAKGLQCAPAAAVARVAAPHLSTLTVRVKPERSWEDLVLPAEDLEAVRELVARYRHRNTVYGPWGYRPLPSAGIIGMFSGPSGTGKTLAAEVIAHSVGCDLFKLDLSSVVSKYIGETEKNLEAIFQAAETGEAVLFFDEADAIFGKRSEVKDAHDRYANVEVAYLLQRLERHDGLVLLATNLAQNIDPAFERRIHVHVPFRLPQAPERSKLWAKAFPPQSPVQDLDLPWLSKWEMTGGIIHNVSMRAAFLAADAGTPISMAVVATAMWKEFHKAGRLVSANDFSPYDVSIPTGN
ncbi:MAG TPA: ATP-binding protein [Acidimicrobiales bacterium]|nr:ATP-binding protein [Acidimicrobiales bacterium]